MSAPGRSESDEVVTFTPIGVFRTRVIDKAVAPRQSGLVPDNEGRVELEPEYHAALAGLEGFDRVWLITWLDRASGWRPIVTPPRANEPLGLFATRAPHRPNPIGLSAVRVERIEPGVVFVRGHDVIEGTPILDLKPYLPYADAHPDAAAGWVDAIDPTPYEVDWAEGAREQARWLLERGVEVEHAVEAVLSLRPHPAPNHRVSAIAGSEGDARLEFAYRMWRVTYRCDEKARRVEVLHVRSEREGDARWSPDGSPEHPADVASVHREFRDQFEGGRK